MKPVHLEERRKKDGSSRESGRERERKHGAVRRLKSAKEKETDGMHLII